VQDEKKANDIGRAIESILTEAVLAAGARRLEDIGEASPAYLAEEAFVAMVRQAVADRLLILADSQ
jgi:hypothetical protein